MLQIHLETQNIPVGTSFFGQFLVTFSSHYFFNKVFSCFIEEKNGFGRNHRRQTARQTAVAARGRKMSLVFLLLEIGFYDSFYSKPRTSRRERKKTKEGENWFSSRESSLVVVLPPPPPPRTNEGCYCTHDRKLSA